MATLMVFVCSALKCIFSRGNNKWNQANTVNIVRRILRKYSKLHFYCNNIHIWNRMHELNIFFSASSQHCSYYAFHYFIYDVIIKYCAKSINFIDKQTNLKVIFWITAIYHHISVKVPNKSQNLCGFSTVQFALFSFIFEMKYDF